MSTKPTGRPATLSAERMAELVARYPHVSNEQLAAEFGVNVKFCKNKAKKLGLNKTAKRLTEARIENRAKMVCVSPLREAIANYITSCRSRGASVAAMTAALSEHHGSVSNAVRHMVDAGRVIEVAGRPNTFFVDQTFADEFSAGRERERLAAEQATKARKRAAEAARRSEEAMRKVRAREREANIDRAFTPNYDTRYQVGPGDEIPRVFSLVPVGVNPMTGRSWSAA
jgi:hypothetical protein